MALVAQNHAVAALRIDRVEQYLPPRPSVTWPHFTGALIPQQADHFTSRVLVQELAAGAVGGRTVVLCQADPPRPTGMFDGACADTAWRFAAQDGVGKTQLAAHYARTAWRDGAVDLLVWVPAGRLTRRRQGILKVYGQAGVEVAGADPARPERAAERFMNWAQSTDRRWLLVLDDVTDPADLQGLQPPQNPNGFTIITARHWDAALLGPDQLRVDVGGYTPEEAASYLADVLSTHNRHDDPAEIMRLAADLDHRPVPLARAAGYLVKNNTHCAAYRAKLTGLSLNERLLGPDHEIVLRDRLERLWQARLFGAGLLEGDACREAYGEIAADYGNLLPDVLIRYGPDGPTTHSALAHLAFALGESGSTARAERILAELVARLKKMYGPGDTRTTQVLQQLARLRGEGPDAPPHGP
ncbi:hypothetical protein [Streptomyces sp. NPDC093094]|uniref:hypothetical protein n=1 Tax=Streptomyces sp. NPDC093094 TaxID=3366026 RepID=UPI0037FA84B9